MFQNPLPGFSNITPLSCLPCCGNPKLPGNSILPGMIDLGGGLILHFQQAPRPWPEAAAPPTTLRVQADGWPLKGGGQPTLGYKWEMWPVWIRDSYTLMYGEVIMVRQSQKSFIQAKLKMPPDIIVHSYLEQVNPSDYLFWDSTS